MKIHSLIAEGLFGYKSRAIIDGLESPTIIIGKNNSGKSSILKAFQIAKRITSGDLQTNSWTFEDHERFQDTNQVSARNSSLSITISLTEQDRQSLTNDLAPLRLNQHPASDSWDAASSKITVDFPSKDTGKAATIYPHGRDRFLPDSLSYLEDNFRNFVRSVFNAKLIPLHAFRRDSEARSTGGSIVKNMHEWRSPDAAGRHLRRRFETIQATFLYLADLENAELVPNASGKSMQVAWKGRYLPFDSFGDGFRHLLIIAYELETNPGAVFLLEEPETHLHPGVQRRLISLCHSRRDAQFIITTHSATILDATRASPIFRVTYDGVESAISRCETRSESFQIFDDLDVRPSDILQANCVVWVEGPSDRTFIIHCISIIDPTLREGVQYQIVFYGGRLRSHLTAGGDRGLVDILNLSRSVAMIADSDRSDRDSSADETKLRLEKEVADANGFYWLTDGREIENYFPAKSVESLLTKLCGLPISFSYKDEFSRFGDEIRNSISDKDDCPKWLLRYEDNKTRFVSALLEHIDKSNITGILRDRISQLCDFIRRAQGGK